MENFYFDPTVAEGLDLLEKGMADVRDSGGLVWSTLVHCLPYILTVYSEELDETTFDPVVTIHANWGETGRLEILGSFTTYQKVEGVFSIVKVVVGEEEYSRDPSTQMLLDDKKLVDEYYNLSFSDWMPDQDNEVKGSSSVGGYEEIGSEEETDHEESENEGSVVEEGNDGSENEEENSAGVSFVVSDSQFSLDDQEQHNPGGSFVVLDSDLRMEDEEENREGVDMVVGSSQLIWDD
jgi:hypothetical protein